MKKSTSTKLALAASTIRPLAAPQLADAAGGVLTAVSKKAMGCGTISAFCTCPEPQ